MEQNKQQQTFPIKQQCTIASEVEPTLRSIYTERDRGLTAFGKEWSK